MHYFNGATNQTGYESALSRIEEITRLTEQFEKSQSQVSKTSFSDILKNTSFSKLKEQFDPMIETAAAENNIDPKLVKAVIEQESGYNPNAVSKAGALGLMQLMPETARELGVKDPLNPTQNIRAGTKYLSSLLNRYQGNVALALSAYNAGPGNVEKYKGVPPFTETQNYVNGIIKKLT